MVSCASCGASFTVAAPGVVETGGKDIDFVHGLDRKVDALTDMLEAVEAPTCTETLIAAFAEAEEVDVGNAVWEGRADVARLTAGAAGIAVDIGAGFGTIATALARSASHVFAVDRSAGRVWATAARARAEGLRNVTAVHGDAAALPLGSRSCDLVLLVGVLEWTGEGQPDALATQRLVLDEAARVLKEGGTLLIGIENRFGVHYFLGLREEHTNLRFSSLLPRGVANAYCRLLQGREMTTYTHSRRALLKLVREAGLQPRIGVALPTYSEPRLSFDLDDFPQAWSFYLRHIFRYSSGFRRIAGALARVAPRPIVGPVMPAFWVAATKRGRPQRFPTVVTGSPECAADIKIIDWQTRAVVRLERKTGRLHESAPLVEGWSARNWISSPLLERRRRRRRVVVLREAAKLLGARERRPLTDDVRRGCLEEARTGIDRTGNRLSAEAHRWCGEQIASLEAADLAMVEEHSDFATVNLVVEEPGSRLQVVDRNRNPRYAIVGLDAVVLATDVLSLKDRTEHRSLSVAMTELMSSPADVLDEASRLLWSDFGADTSVDLAVALTATAVLRYAHNRILLPDLGHFLNRAATGELQRVLQCLHPA